MRKLFLLAAVALTGLTANAQLLQSEAAMEQAQMPMPQRAPQQAILSRVSADNNKQGMKKSMANGVWYQVEAGIPYYGWDKEGRGYYASYVVVPAFTDFATYNKATKPSTTKWFINETDYTELADENNNMVLSVEAGYYMPTYTLKSGSGLLAKSFNLSELIIDEYKNQGKKASYFYPRTGISPLTFADPHILPSYYGVGYLDSKYLFGPGYVADEDVTYRCYGYAEEYAKPASPMYVEDVHVEALCYGNNPIPEGEEIQMVLTDADDNDFATLTCKAEDLIKQGEVNTPDGDKFTRYCAVFSNKEVDPLTGEMISAPFVIDKAFTLYILYSKNSTLGFYGYPNTDDVMPVNRGRNLVYNVNNPEEALAFSLGFGDNMYCSVPVTFNGLFDKAIVWDTVADGGETIENFNVIKVSADGQEYENAGYPTFGGIQAYTANPWFDEDGNEYYYLDVFPGMDYPEWITGYKVYDSLWHEKEDFKPIVVVQPQCDPLPAGVTGRGCKLYIVGRGFTSKEPIYVLQGDYTKEQCDADEAPLSINSVTVNKNHATGTYNLAGQRVGNGFKGIVIKDGKKILTK